MSTIPPPLPPAMRPKPPNLGSGQRLLIGLAMVLAISITALSVAFVIRTQGRAKKVENQFGVFEEAKQRQSERFQKYRSAVAALPAGTLPENWSCKKTLESLSQAEYELIQTLANSFFAGGNQFLPLDLVELVRTLDAKTQLSEFETSIHPRSHSSQDIEKRLLDFLHASAELSSLAVAARNGIYYVDIDPTRSHWEHYDRAPDRDAPGTLLALRALLEARWGGVDEAMQAYLDTVRFADLIGWDPYLANYSTKHEIEWRVDTALWELAARADFTGEQEQTIQQALAARGDTSRLKELIIEDAELAFPRTANKEQLENPFLEKMFSYTGVYDRAKTHNAALKLAALVDKPYREMEDAIKKMDEDKVGAGWYIGDVAEDATTARRAQLRGTLTSGAMHVALALKRYKAEHATYPPALDPLVPDYIESVPIDPIANLPIAYMTWEQGYFLLQPSDTAANQSDADSEYEYDDTAEFSYEDGYRRTTLWHAKQ